MKTLALMLLTSLLAPFSVPGQSYQLVKKSDLQQVLADSRKDSLQKLERLAALEFHRLQNNYRKQNKLDTLFWNDVMWLASRNHSLYEAKNEILTHDQDKWRQFYSGENLLTRLDYVQGREDLLLAWGENCDFVGSVPISWMMSNGTPLKEIAHQIAATALNGYQNSPPHNANMLNKVHQYHAGAITIRGNYFWGANLFAVINTYYTPPAKPVKTDAPLVASTDEKAPPSVTEPYRPKVKASRAAAKLDKEMNKHLTKEYKQLQTDYSLTKTAEAHLQYLTANQSESHLQEKGRKEFLGVSPEERYLKVKHGFWSFLHSKPKGLTEAIAHFKVNAEDSEYDALLAQLQTEWYSEAGVAFSDAHSRGFSIQVNQRGEELEVFAVLLLMR